MKHRLPAAALLLASTLLLGSCAAGLAVIAVWQFRRPECTYSKKACMALLSAACVVILVIGLVQGVPALLAGLGV